MCVRVRVRACVHGGSECLYARVCCLLCFVLSLLLLLLLVHTCTTVQSAVLFDAV